MTEVVQTMINELMDATKVTTENIYRQGVVEGVKIVKNLVETDDAAKDINTLIQSLDLFIKKYEVKIEAPITPVEDNTGSVDEIKVEEVKEEPEHCTENVQKEEDPIPVPVELGPVIIEEETKEKEEPIPVPVEPGPVITEELLMESDSEEKPEGLEE